MKRTLQPGIVKRSDFFAALRELFLRVKNGVLYVLATILAGTCLIGFKKTTNKVILTNHSGQFRPVKLGRR
jgi:hypothetical protein